MLAVVVRRGSTNALFHSNHGLPRCGRVDDSRARQRGAGRHDRQVTASGRSLRTNTPAPGPVWLSQEGRLRGVEVGGERRQDLPVLRQVGVLAEVSWSMIWQARDASNLFLVHSHQYSMHFNQA